MRYKIYKVIEKGDTKLSEIYDFTMMSVILFSLVPLFFKQTNTFFIMIDKVTVTLFIIDYFARLSSADFKLKKGKASLLISPFTPMAIIDLIAILPSLSILNNSLKIFKILDSLERFVFLRFLK